MSYSKLNIQKFRITRLNGVEHIIGGNTLTFGDTTTTITGTELDPPKEPVCIKTSKEYIENA